MKGSDHLIKLAFERRVRTAWPIRWGGGSARKLIAAPKDHLFVIVDARRACLNPDSIRNFPPSDPASCRCDTGKRGWRKMEEGRCARAERSSGRRRRSAVKWNARWCRLSSLFARFHPPLLACLHAPFHSFPSLPLSLHASFGFLSFRGLHASLYPSFPLEMPLPFVPSFRVFPTPLFPLLFSSREFLTRPFRAPPYSCLFWTGNGE